MECPEPGPAGANAGRFAGGSRPSASDIASAFRGRVDSGSASLGYRLALLLGCVGMLVLPAIYLGIVALAAAAVGWFARRWFEWVRSATGGTAQMGPMVALYALGLFVGLFVVFFLVKPLFSGRRRKSQPLALSQAAEPLLFAFVHMVADVVGAPRPARIDVDCRLNASAGFRRGLVSLAGRDFVLSIGLPLVAAFDARTLAGVVAHELGHFKQGWGLRASYLVRGINAWLGRVAYDRDSWDDAVEDYAGRSGSGVGRVVLAMARSGVWISRSVLVVLVHLGHAVSCLLLRQLEFDADRCQIAVAGTANFEQAMGRIHVLGEAAREFYRQLRVRWETDRRLPEDAPSAIADAEATVPAERRARLVSTALARESALFDSHPTDRDRLERARNAVSPGLFEMDLPASALFSSFETITHQATILHYEGDLGLPRERIQWLPREVGQDSCGPGKS